MKMAKYAIVAAATLAASSLVSRAAVITFNYDSTVTYASNTAFTQGTGTAAIVGNSVTIPSGDFFQFNVNVLVTNNINPASGGAWDQNNGTTQPLNLGIAAWGLFFNDSNVSAVVPRVVGGDSVVKLLNEYAENTRGTASATVGNAGTVNAPISGGFIPAGQAFGSQPSTFPTITLGAGIAQDIFTALTYQAVGIGTALLTPGMPPSTPGDSSIGYVINATLGDAADPPTYNLKIVTSTDTADTVNELPVLTVSVPEPASCASLLLGTGVQLIGRRRRASTYAR